MKKRKTFLSKSRLKLNQLALCLSNCSDVEKKLNFFSQHGFVLPKWLNWKSWSPQEKIILLSLHAIDQLDRLNLNKASSENLEYLLKNLILVEDFYGFLGGIVGYHVTCLRLINQKAKKQKKGDYHKPQAYDISKKTKKNRSLRLMALRHLGEFAEIYPIGGAADRLSSSKPQIAATRLFCEKSFLERLIDDVKAKEALAFRIYGYKITIPIVLMTSDEKDGTRQVQKILEEKNWYERDPKSFFLVSQPLVPSMTLEGDWISTGAGCLLFKPGGHGVLWKVCRDQGALNWLKSQGKSKVLIRQINNPIAGVDDGFLIFMGRGIEKKGKFGFSSCPRVSNVSEGVNVVIETKRGFTLTNIEYCDFEHFQIDPHADLLANTNLLYANIKTVEEVLETVPVPGLLVNSKPVTVTSNGSKKKLMVINRLESTMQNLADGLVSSHFPTSVFITTNSRIKTISSIKCEGSDNQIIPMTSGQCFVDMQRNARDLFEKCNVTLEEGVVVEYHPCLGPFYDIIVQKIFGGVIKKKSHLKMSISEIELKEFVLDGGMTIESLCLNPCQEEGKCVLNQVQVVNLGLDRDRNASLLSSPRIDYERCTITIEQGGEFYASNVCLKGNLSIYVPKWTRVEAVMVEKELKFIKTPIKRPSWRWKYTVGEQDEILLEKQPLSQ